MSWRKAFQSSIGMKTLMATSGIVLVLFVIGHMVGNLQVYAGPDTLNRYAAALKAMPALLWPVRAALLFFFVLHVFVGLRLYRLNRQARPVRYVYEHTEEATFASRFMLQSGLVILAFLVYHLLHFTFGVTHPDQFHYIDAQGRHDVYKMFILGFRSPLISASYVVAQVFLGLHLYHGVPSIFQSLGLKTPKYEAALRRTGLAVAVLVVAGNIAMPVSVWVFGLGSQYVGG